MRKFWKTWGTTIKPLPQVGEYWHTTIEGSKGVRIRKKVCALDEFVIVDLYMFGSDEPQTEKKIPFSAVTNRITLYDNPARPIRYIPKN